MNKSLLSRNKIFDILKEFKELGGNRVVFTGGEPTLNPDLVDIVSCTKQLNLEQHIITNGVFLNKLNLRLLVDNISQFNISIDTTDLSEISKLWNVPNYSEYYSELINGIDKLNSAIVDYKGEKPKVTIMPVVTRINLNSIIDLMKTINNRFLFKIYWKFTKYGKIGIDDIDKKLEISDEEYLKVLYDVGKKALSLDEDKAVAFAVTHCGERIIRDKPMMGLCSPSFFVTNHGDVYPCQGLERDQYYLGSIYDNSLTELYNKNIFSDIRKTLFPKYIKKCAECDLRFICNERCSLCNLECTATKCKDAVIRRMYYKLKQG